MSNLNHIEQIQDLVRRGAIFYISHSAGKDSQAMFILLSAIIPADQIVIVHADLGDIEHIGVQEHILATIGDFELNVVRAGKTFFDMVERRMVTRPDVPSFPSSSTRQCTSDLKRDPIYKFIRADMKARGSLLAVNVMGLRAGESSARAKKATLTTNDRLSKAGREIYDWLPIHELNCRVDAKFDPATMDDDVFNVIRDAGQEPHQVYLEGNDRLSCVFCIMGSRNDIANGARLRPDLLAKIAELEERSGYTMFKDETIQERAGLIPVREVA
jgi:3'-phosphoadenosine 5'-phosphosulfate sulfotransferase (PAPS reductase)/FAD synthetase